MQTDLNDDRLLTRSEVQSYFGISQRFLETSITKGGGPPVFRIGRNVRYRVGELRDWINGRRIGAGSEKD